MTIMFYGLLQHINENLNINVHLNKSAFSSMCQDVLLFASLDVKSSRSIRVVGSFCWLTVISVYLENFEVGMRV